ncbi:MAG: hypothetical protein US38_C0006G0056 [Candidatus Roizmanbacteria bacterium GW2011_GWC1_37_12]|nr:MAG: hypothetical protein US38_C0006G0056 [Candidatus Roizmanbacteria bacterium GW2011_GWC1_37_12]
MKFCTPINTNNAVRFAMKLLLSSKESVDMTMDMQGEIDHPLPQRYHHLIARLVKCKITVARYMYGEKKLFEEIKNRYEGVRVYYGGKMDRYQRMLIIDKKKGMFALNGNIFFTTFKPLINSLFIYISVN